jgi:glycosyltransferase involved in cell wall biosynthesis
MNAKNKDIRILIMCLSDPSTDPRPLRSIKVCRSEGYAVSVLGLRPKSNLEVQSYFYVDKPLITMRAKVYRNLLALTAAIPPFNNLQFFLDIDNIRFGLKGVIDNLTEESFDLLIVEDLQLLPLANKIKKSGKILFDAREYYPRQIEGSIKFNLLEKPRRISLCRHYLPLCDAIVTVSEGLRNEYQREFGIEVELLRSVPEYLDISTSPTKSEKIRLVHHGLASKNRGLHKMIDIFQLLDRRFYLDLVLVGNDSYKGELIKRAAAYKSRINFLDPVPYEEIIPFLSYYDVGFFYCEPKTFNLKHCLPNKFFEFIQARLMLAIGPSPDMAELINKYKCGIVADEFSVESMANALNSLTKIDIDKAKQHSNIAAKELCFEKESLKLIEIINDLTQTSTSAKVRRT